MLFLSRYLFVSANSPDAPKIQRFQFPEKLEVNEKVGATCMLRSGKPPYTFRWLKDGKGLENKNGIIIENGERLSHLLIDPITYASAASPSWNEEPFDVETTVGEKVSVKCSASGYPNPKIEWIKKDDVAFFLRRDSSTSRNSTLLLFNPVRIVDGGEYVCIASNAYTDTKIEMPIMKFNILYLFASTVIDTVAGAVNDSPKIQHTQVPSMVEIGEKINIPCMIRKGSPPFHFEWFKNSAAIKSSENFQIVDTSDSSRLTINPVTEKSSGNYTCTVRTKFGSDRMTIYISVKAPPAWSYEPKDIETIEGESTSIPCSADGSPAPRINWKRLDLAKTFTDSRILSNNGTLQFIPVNKSHEGSYVCEAYNDVGSPLKKIVSLTVHEAPVIQPFSLPERIQIGKSLSLSCAVMSGTPPLNFKWYRNQKLLQTENIKSSNKKVSFLTIDPIVENSGGNYSCIVSNSKGQDHFSAVLVVTAPPIWISEPEDKELVENEKLNLKCLASGAPNPRIIWKRLENSQNRESSTSLKLNSENGSLILDPVLKIHEGNYMCTADNGAGHPLSKTVTIVIRGRKKFVYKLF
ncbi:hemicentin-1 [Trichonephila inaurata madagascariensis]|uniref:Hemicentin-1 n=1 Tax=Trichonephila inaurata madagascariensis TaxID=2747483 RepID=A0A8X6X726_9ARAC|nr:hemicentin-1 [Trichonephila inaurata madagascariensis]